MLSDTAVVSTVLSAVSSIASYLPLTSAVMALMADCISATVPSNCFATPAALVSISFLAASRVACTLAMSPVSFAYAASLAAYLAASSSNIFCAAAASSRSLAILSDTAVVSTVLSAVSSVASYFAFRSSVRA